MINPKNDECCLKLAVTVLLHDKEMSKNSQHISKQQYCKDWYDWNRLEFPLAIQKIGMFEKNKPDKAENMPFIDKESIYTAHITELKACVHYFLSNFYFSPNDSRSKTIKNVFYFI